MKFQLSNRFIFVSIFLLIFFANSKHSISAQKPPDSWCSPPAVPTEFSGSIKIAVLPHHVVAKKLWTPIFNNWKTKKLKTIVILAPNHESSGAYFLTSALHSSDIQLDTVTITQMNTLGIVGIDDEVSWSDHSIGAFIPMLKEQFPDVLIIPILFKKQTPIKQLKALAQFLAHSDTTQTVYLASIDFSHDMTPSVAFQKDQEMIRLIQTKQSTRILHTDSTYSDSPSVLFSLQELANSFRLTSKLKIHAHAGQFLYDCFSPTTTYQLWTY